MKYTSVSNNKSILELNNEEAKRFFLKSESYCNIDLPKYVNFSDLLLNIDVFLSKTKINDIGGKQARNFEDVNYLLLNNKDGKFAWRPFELIHPVIYIALVNELTEVNNWNLIKERFQVLHKNKKINCLSMPIESSNEKQQDKAAQITEWWHSVEQKSIELALEYDYLFETDITDCYSSIYTHSIPWALHNREFIKEEENRNNKELLGNKIDTFIQSMRYAQTNGIPQGSVLMDLIAEMVLGYADYLISQKLKAKNTSLDYKILRYRDDFRIFVNDPTIGNLILKIISEELSSLGLKMNSSKTKSTDNIISNSIKKDKVAWLKNIKKASNLQKRLFLIHDHSKYYSNSGSLAGSLADFYNDLKKVKKPQPASIKPMISITTDIALHNPRHLPACSAILSYLIIYLKNDTERLDIIDKIQKKFKKIPNTGFLDMWLQRITLSFEPNKEYEEKVCKLINGNDTSLWNSKWISSPELKSTINSAKITNQEEVDNLPRIIDTSEFSIFSY